MVQRRVGAVHYGTTRALFIEALEALKALADSGQDEEGSQTGAVWRRIKALQKEGLELCKKEEAVLGRLGEVTVELNEVIDELKARE